MQTRSRLPRGPSTRRACEPGVNDARSLGGVTPRYPVQVRQPERAPITRRVELTAGDVRDGGKAISQRIAMDWDAHRRCSLVKVAQDESVERVRELVTSLAFQRPVEPQCELFSDPRLAL